MTLIVGWLACDQRRPCSAYIASDSRISTIDGNSYYDYSPKVFALKNTPDIFGYCGESIFTYQFLARLVNMCDAGLLLSADMDFEERDQIIYTETRKAHRAYKLTASPIRIYHIGRNHCQLFDSSLYDWDGKGWSSQRIKTDYRKSAKLFSDGSGRAEYEKRFLLFKDGNNQDTSRNYFHCFCDTMKDIKDRHTGGIPQLAGLYNGKKFNGMYHGIIIGGQAYYQALKVDQVYGMSNIRWYNEEFEICDLVTGQRQEGAMRQPISKKATP